MHVFISAVSRSQSPSGICRHAANLAHGLASTQEVAKITLVVGAWQAEYFRTSFALQHPKVHLTVAASHSSSVARNYWYRVALPQLVAEHAPDILHVSFPIPFLRSRFHCPVVSTIHDLYPYDIPANFGRARFLFNRFCLRLCVRGSDHLICVSESTMARLNQLFPALAPGTVSRIYNCVSEVLPSEGLAMPFAAARPFILAVAQHRKNKNLALLLNSFQHLLMSGALDPSTFLVLVGALGPESERLSRLVARLSLNSRVAMISDIQDAELGWLYRHCLVLVAPSSFEGFNLPVAEALSCGARVVCSDIPVHREVGGAAGQYFDLFSSSPVEELANAICRSLAGPPSTAGNMRAFSTALIASQHVALYQELLRMPSSLLGTLDDLHHDTTHESVAR